eukprot:56869-Rhodomonas_salina.6
MAERLTDPSDAVKRKDVSCPPSLPPRSFSAAHRTSQPCAPNVCYKNPLFQCTLCQERACLHFTPWQPAPLTRSLTSSSR